MSRICGYCEAAREFRPEERVETYTVRGMKLEFPVKVEVCTECGQDLYDEASDDDLVTRAYAAYRVEKGLLGPDEIVAIRNRYQLSQKSLATLLGMSEATINRYENGALQDDTHDSALRLAASPENIKGLLDRRGHLLSDWQRKRAVDAVEAELSSRIRSITWMMPQGATERTGMREFDYDRYAAVVIWFCVALDVVYRTQMNKLLFYADFLAFRHFGRSITGAAYRKIQYGPVPADYGGLEDALEADDLITIVEGQYPNGQDYILYRPGPAAAVETIALDAQEQRVLAFVAEQFRGEGAKALSKRSHEENAYVRTENKQIISYKHAATLSLSLPDKE